MGIKAYLGPLLRVKFVVLIGRETVARWVLGTCSCKKCFGLDLLLRHALYVKAKEAKTMLLRSQKTNIQIFFPIAR